jgi:hypothetical protein
MQGQGNGRSVMEVCGPIKRWRADAASEWLLGAQSGWAGNSAAAMTTEDDVAWRIMNYPTML